jgi:hypothetical protein
MTHVDLGEIVLPNTSLFVFVGLLHLFTFLLMNRDSRLYPVGHRWMESGDSIWLDLAINLCSACTPHGRPAKLEVDPLACNLIAHKSSGL